jgi:peptide chain release factor subunit 1
VLTSETIDRIARLDGDGLPVVSAYVSVPVDPKDRSALRTRAASLVHRIRPMAEDDSLDRKARLSMREDIERIEEAVADGDWKPGAIALFSCSGAGLFDHVPLPRAVPDHIHVDQTPWVRPLAAVLDELHRYCVAVIDRKSARAWELYQGEFLDARELEDEALRKPDYAGWQGYEEHRVSNRADELAKRHFHRTAELLEELFRIDRYELLVLGGRQEELPLFIELLPGELRERVAGTFSVDPHTASPGQIRELADAVVERYEEDEERKLVDEVFDSAAAGGRAALGLDRCLWAGSVAAVDKLLVQMDAEEPGVVCDECGWLACEGEACPICGGPTRQTPDVIDELVERVFAEGGSVEHVGAETQLKEQQVAASLRFPLPADSGTASVS